MAQINATLLITDSAIPQQKLKLKRTYNCKWL